MKFAIAIEPGTKETAFGVVVPDLPGCFSAGDSIEEAYDNAREAIEAFCEILIEQETDLPTPKPMQAWMKDPEYKGWMWGIVDVPVEKFFGPAEKINITVPERLLRKIDAAAAASGEGRSGYLVESAMRRIAGTGPASGKEPRARTRRRNKRHN